MDFFNDDMHIKKYMDDFYTKASSIMEPFWIEASIDTRFEAGDQEVWNSVYPSIGSRRRKQFNFNRIRRAINMVSGYQRNNRKSTIVIPIEDADQETADQFTKVMYWVNRRDDVLQTISDAFQSALISGLSFLHVWVDYRKDPINGNIRVDKCSYNSLLLDPYFKNKDLSDCNNIWKRSYVSKREAISLLPDKKEEIINAGSGYAMDGKFSFMSESNVYATDDLVSYDEFYYRSYREQLLLVDINSGESLEWNGKNDDALRDYLDNFPQIELHKQQVPTVRMAVLVNNELMYDGANPLGIDDFPFVPVYGYFNSDITEFENRIQGMVRGLRDAQFLYNRRKNIELDILESQVTSGWVFKEDALVNPKDVFMTQQGKGIAIKSNANIADLQRIDPPQVPPSMMELSQQLSNEIQEISGVSDELLGSAQDDKAGILSMLRQGAGLTTLQNLFDGLDFSQKKLGQLIVDIVQNNFTPSKVQKIVKQEPAPQFYKKAFGKYGSAIEEGLNTTTQQQMQFAQLLHLKELGVPIPSTLLVDNSTLQNKNELNQAIQQEEQQQQQMQQAQQESEIKEQQARTELARSRAEADRGLGAERLSKVKNNEAETIKTIFDAKESNAQSIERRASALYDYIKSIKDIEQLDLNNLAKLIDLARVTREELESEQSPNPMEPEVPSPPFEQYEQGQQAMSSPLQQLSELGLSQGLPEPEQPQSQPEPIESGVGMGGQGNPIDDVDEAQEPF